MKTFVLSFALFFVVLPCQAQEKDLTHTFNANVGVNISRIKGLDDAGFGLMLGGKYTYFFGPRVGVFLGLDYMQRNASENGLEFELSSLDVPVGFAFRYGNMFDTETTTFLGLYYSSLLDGKGSNSINLQGEDHFGLVFQSETYFEATPGFDLGFFVGFKFGFGDAITRIGSLTSTDVNNTLDFNLGLASRF